MLGNSSVSHAPSWHLCAHVFPCHLSINGSIYKFSAVTSWTPWSRAGDCSIFSCYSCWCHIQQYHPQIARCGHLHGRHVHLSATSCRNLRTWRPRLHSVCRTLCLCAVFVPVLSVYGRSSWDVYKISVFQLLHERSVFLMLAWAVGEMRCPLRRLKDGASISSFVVYCKTSRSYYHVVSAQCSTSIKIHFWHIFCMWEYRLVPSRPSRVRRNPVHSPNIPGLYSMI